MRERGSNLCCATRKQHLYQAYRPFLTTMPIYDPKGTHWARYTTMHCFEEDRTFLTVDRCARHSYTEHAPHVANILNIREIGTHSLQYGAIRRSDHCNRNNDIRVFIKGKSHVHGGPIGRTLWASGR